MNKYEWEQYEKYQEKLGNVTAVVRHFTKEYPSEMRFANGGDKRCFIEWLHEQDGYNMDRNAILDYIEKPWRWNLEWSRFVEAMKQQKESEQ